MFLTPNCERSLTSCNQTCWRSLVPFARPKTSGRFISSISCWLEQESTWSVSENSRFVKPIASTSCLGYFRANSRIWTGLWSWNSQMQSEVSSFWCNFWVLSSLLSRNCCVSSKQLLQWRSAVWAASGWELLSGKLSVPCSAGTALSALTVPANGAEKQLFHQNNETLRLLSAIAVLCWLSSTGFGFRFGNLGIPARVW